MDFKFVPTNPGEIKLTAEITMSLQEWKDLYSATGSSKVVSSQFRRKIEEIIEFSTKHFYPKDE